ncbi:MAG: benzoate-CoA ligase family protein [Rhodospirillaceae bacterium]|jgi:benzoate-CoA ligase family protein|nr:benzoate-CoA ligase family protein [Rhodospirillaceae bacterium]MBT6405558.1 benzoate-CoA ligase family protein [Rhodospirillaceae bacterium]MBT6535407.1 benzoate-CoA ligase family protein [Rhodospirillaceae bacterium]
MSQDIEHQRRIDDPVGPDTAGTREIGFAVPERYNASEILFRNLDAGRGARTAILAADISLTYQDLCDLAGQAGNALRDCGLRRGDRVAMVLDDTPVYPAAFFGAVRAGYVPVLINILSTPDLLRYYIEDSAAPIVMCEAALLDTLHEALADGPAVDRVIVVNGEADGEVSADFPIPIEGWDAFIGGQGAALDVADTHRDEMAFWMYSSGSTGRPKGIVHLQHDMLYTDLSYGQAVLELSEDDIIYSVPKIFFAYGFGNSITFPFSAGAAVVLNAGRPEPAPIYDAIERHKPTVFFGLPTLYNALVAYEGSEDRDLGSVRLCLSAAEPLPEETFNEWRRRYGLEIVEGLGSTEVLHIYVSNFPGDIRAGAAGKRVPGYEIKLVDMDGEPVALGEPGTMWVRGDSQAPFYWNQPDKTADTMRDDWIYTGDRFQCDEDGFYKFDGRADDLIKVSGQWIYPLEIERCLNDHPDVQESCVLGVAAHNGLMTTKAWVVMKAAAGHDDATTQRLQDYVKTKLVPYKYPRIVEFRGDLPKTGTGKIDRQALRADETENS